MFSEEPYDLPHRKDAPDAPCPQCLQTGHVCLKCNKSKYDCHCSVGEYNDTICPTCNGRGVIEK
jgi:hypothetical protein